MAEGLAQVESTESVNPALVTVEGGLADRIPMGITMIQAMAIVKAWAPDPPKLCAASTSRFPRGHCEGARAFLGRE